MGEAITQSDAPVAGLPKRCSVGSGGGGDHGHCASAHGWKL
ncbi:MAG TPA: hypothetical protein VJM79_02095 [Rhizorhapis sp.]|nr:hypothetical protein [Rhizorhapis sp.]